MTAAGNSLMRDATNGHDRPRWPDAAPGLGVFAGAVAEHEGTPLTPPPMTLLGDAPPALVVSQPNQQTGGRLVWARGTDTRGETRALWYDQSTGTLRIYDGRNALIGEVVVPDVARAVLVL